MSAPIHIVFTPDRRFLPGLHVTAYSVLASCRSAEHPIYFHIFSDSLTAQDVALLEATLRGVNRPFVLELQKIQADVFASFPADLGQLVLFLEKFFNFVIHGLSFKLCRHKPFLFCG